MSAVVFKKDKAVTDELEEMKLLVDGFLAGDIPNEKFKPRRVHQGTYGQRQAGVQMLRVKLPAGNVNYDQLMAIAKVAKDYGNSVLHISTRQNIQLHYIKTEHVPQCLEDFANVGLTTREACGNAVRNVSASPFSGSTRDETFDMTSTAEVITRYFLRNENNQKLPRKFKFGLSESNADIGVTGMHDIGVIAKIKDGKPGYKIVVGGGLGGQPFPALLYNEFIPVEDLLIHSEAIISIFNQHGDRVKRMKARLKFLVKKWGIEKFKEEVAKEIDVLKSKNIVYPKINIQLEKTENFDFSNPFDKNNEKKQYLWYKKNVYATKRKDEYMIMVNVPLGDFNPQQTTKICNQIKTWHEATKYSRGEFITVTDDQNFVIKGLIITDNRKTKFNEILSFLETQNLGQVGAHDGGDPVSCPGSSTCNLGITQSKGLAGALRDSLKEKLVYDERYDGTTIHISGCPNSCGRHHLGTLAFFGRSEMVTDEMQAPAYNVMIGGSNKGDGEIVIAKRCQKILAKRVPDFVDTFIEKFEASDSNNFVEYCNEISKDEVNLMIAKYSKDEKPVTDQEKINFDFNEDTPYVMEFGEGECGF